MQSISERENKENSESGYETVLNMLVKRKFNTAGYQVKIPLEHLITRLRRTLYFVDLSDFVFRSYVYVPKYYNIDLYCYKGDNYSDSDTMLKWFEKNKQTLKYELSKIYLFSNMIVGYITLDSRPLKIILATSRKHLANTDALKPNKSSYHKRNDRTSEREHEIQGTPLQSGINLNKANKYTISSIPIILNGAMRCYSNSNI